MRLLRYLTRATGCSTQEARKWLLEGKIEVDEAVATSAALEVGRFSRVRVNGKVLPHERAVYLMLHKPVGYVSATVDAEHETVIDLIDHPQKDELHLAGRLDRSTSGLVLLTNDGAWSKRLSDRESKVAKVYVVETETPIPEEAVAMFEAGFHFPTEDIVTRPVELAILTPTSARLVLTEGRYHQIKRMFHRVETRVKSLHRERVGPYVLPADLAAGEWREVDPKLV